MPIGEQPVGTCGGGAHFLQLHERRAVLGDQDATLVQAAPAGLVEVLGEQHLARADRVGGVGDDHVEAFFRGSHEAHAVVDHQVQPRVVEGALGVVGQERLAHVDHGAVDLDHGDPLDALVLGHLAQHTAVAAADDQHAPGRAVGEDRHVGEHLVVDELVGLGGLDHSVERHHPAHPGVFENHQVLVLGAHLMQHVVDAEALAVALVQSFLIIAHGPGSPW
ncbi:hypothetical protein PAERUG_P18_London_17_VIM_2_04_10_02879 [Pseudomonas aeruginosa]|nr:hypothetical protein PAERUG_P18_London_17_VIM_2_04_10_02879 [Pseudomonas aeruginosa]